MTEVSATQLPADTIVTSVGKTNSSFDPQSVIILTGNGRTKNKKLVYNIERIDSFCYLGSDMMHTPIIRLRRVRTLYSLYFVLFGIMDW